MFNQIENWTFIKGITTNTGLDELFETACLLLYNFNSGLPSFWLIFPLLKTLSNEK